MLEAEITPCRKPPEIAGQIVRVHVNGILLGDTLLSEQAMIRCEIDPAITRDDGILDVVFEFPAFFRPDALRHSKDTRPLSGAFTVVRAYTKDMFTPDSRRKPGHPGIPVAVLSPPQTEAPWLGSQPTVYTFGPGGTARPFLRNGWHDGVQGESWTIASSGRLELPAPSAPGIHVLRLDVKPPIAAGAVPFREVTIALERIVIGQFKLAERAILFLPLPRELVEGRAVLAIDFILPDASQFENVRLADDTWQLGLAFERIDVIPLPPELSALGSIRTDQPGSARPMAVSNQFLGDDDAALPAAIEAALGLDPVSLLRGFESLGSDSEFGVVQRNLGLDVLNFFRFGHGTCQNLIRALADDLNAASDAGALTVELNDAEPREYVLSLRPYDMHWDSFVKEYEASPQTLWRAQAVRFDYLRRKFHEGLRAGRKIYVVNQRRPFLLREAVALLMELRRHGSATLLCVEPASAAHRSGEVEMVAPGLMRGYLKSFAPATDVEATDTSGWLRVTANAALLRRASPDMGVTS